MEYHYILWYNRKNKGGGTIGSKDKLRALIELAQEAYELAATPPALDYSKHIDPTYRDDLTRRSRSFLLRFGIDVKMAVENTLNNLPEARAAVLNEWIAGGRDTYFYTLTYKKQFYLKIDRLTLKDAIKGKNTYAHNEKICGDL